MKIEPVITGFEKRAGIKTEVARTALGNVASLPPLIAGLLSGGYKHTEGFYKKAFFKKIKKWNSERLRSNSLDKSFKEAPENKKIHDAFLETNPNAEVNEILTHRRGWHDVHTADGGTYTTRHGGGFTKSAKDHRHGEDAGNVTSPPVKTAAAMKAITKQLARYPAHDHVKIFAPEIFQSLNKKYHEKQAALAKGFLAKAVNKVKKSPHLHHGIELAGLGTLAAPSAYHMATGKDMSEKNKHRAELGGLGILAGPSLAHAGKAIASKFKR